MHIKDHATAQGWFRRHAAAPSSVGSWKAFVARNKKVQERPTMAQEPRNMAHGGIIGKPGGIVEPGIEYYGNYVRTGYPASQFKDLPKKDPEFKQWLKDNKITDFDTSTARKDIVKNF